MITEDYHQHYYNFTTIVTQSVMFLLQKQHQYTKLHMLVYYEAEKIRVRVHITKTFAIFL